MNLKQMRINELSVFIIIVITIIFSSCEKIDVDKMMEAEEDRLIAYFTANNIIADTLDEKKGLYYIHGKTGIGEKAEEGDYVSFYYIGSYLSGKELKTFDTNIEGEPFRFKLGAGEVIKGLDQGIVDMHEGDTGTLIIESDLGYEGIKNGPIPEYSTLFFEIEIVSIEKE